MIKFFRKIRQNLLSEGKTGKYLKYAIGETLLVMIGILLALQVNTWNEKRKSNKFENLILVELLNTIKTDISTINKTKQGNLKAQESCKIILTHFDEDLKYDDSLNIHFGLATEWWLLTLNESAYKNAQNYGLHFIENDTSRKLLNYIYDSRLPYYNNIIERHTKYHYDNVEPLYAKLFESSKRIGNSTSFRKIPFNYQTLKNDKGYRNVLKTSIRDREKENVIIDQILGLMKDAIPLLEREINSKYTNKK